MVVLVGLYEVLVAVISERFNIKNDAFDPFVEWFHMVSAGVELFLNG